MKEWQDMLQDPRHCTDLFSRCKRILRGGDGGFDDSTIPASVDKYVHV